MSENNELTPCLSRIKPYKSAESEVHQIREGITKIEQEIRTMEWMAAGGIGAGNREAAIETINAQISNLQSLREQVEALDDPREVGRVARNRHSPCTPENSERTDNEQIETEIIDPDAPVKFVRLVIDGEEAAMIPWNEAKTIANEVNCYNNAETNSDDS